MTTLEIIVAELQRQYEESRGGFAWFDYDEEDRTARIDGRVDLKELAKAVENREVDV